MEDIIAVVLAAGKGTRMKTNKAKVVHKIYGKELITRVVETAWKAGIKDVVTAVRIQKRRSRKGLRRQCNLCLSRGITRNWPYCHAGDSLFKK